MDLVVHGMAGFDNEAARSKLQIPEDFAVDAMIAIGKPGSLDSLPGELKDKETPSSRKPLREIITEGTFNFD